MSEADNLKKMVGIITFDIINTIVDDIKNIISRKTPLNTKIVDSALDGYILALSRILENHVSWKCVVQAFKESSAEIPDKYFIVFGIEKEKENDIVSDAARRSDKQPGPGSVQLHAQ